MFDKLRQWFTQNAVEIPEELSVCVFECRKSECQMGDWEKCEQRLEGLLPGDEGQTLN